MKNNVLGSVDKLISQILFSIDASKLQYTLYKKPACWRLLWMLPLLPFFFFCIRRTLSCNSSNVKAKIFCLSILQILSSVFSYWFYNFPFYLYLSQPKFTWFSLTFDTDAIHLSHCFLLLHYSQLLQKHYFLYSLP